MTWLRKVYDTTRGRSRTPHRLIKAYDDGVEDGSDTCLSGLDGAPRLQGIQAPKDADFYTPAR